jgi:alkylhydroperoxidase family enzyme
MARIPYFDFDTLDEKNKQFFSLMPKLNIFRMMAHAASIRREFIKLGAAILYNGRLDPILREFAIIRTGILCGSSYEVHQHRALARKLKMPDEKMEALAVGSSSPAFNELERLVIRMTEEIFENRKASDETFSALSARLSHAEMVELTVAIGYYQMVSCFLETLQVDIE